MAETRQSCSESVKRIAEVFLIRTESIYLSGALFALNDDRVVAKGVVRFGRGERVAFSSAPGEIATLSKQLMSICRNIAEFYDTKVLHQDFMGVDESNSN